MTFGLSLVSLIVPDYDEAITFFVGKLGFDLVEDKPSLTNDGRPKRWVVVRPPGSSSGGGGGCGILIAQADGEMQREMVGRQFAERVGLFWTVEDFEETYARLVEAEVVFVKQPWTEEYGRLAVFRDLVGNKWDLIEPRQEKNKKI